MADLQWGFSVAFMRSVIGVGALDLVLARERFAPVKRVALINAIWLAVMTANSLRYFFVAPASFLVAALLIFRLVWRKLPVDGTS